MRRFSSLFLTGFLALAVASTPGVAEAQKKGAKKSPSKKVEKSDKKGDKKGGSDRPGDSQASTKGLEEALKKTAEPIDNRRLAPAKLMDTPGKEVSRDELADKRRDEAIEQIKKILPKQKHPEVRADLLFQLAELWWEKSRFVNMAQEMPAFEAEQVSWNKCRTEKGEKACPSEPRINNRKSELYRKNAVDLYAQVIREYPQYKRIDEIRFILAYNKYDLATSGGEDKCKGRNALDAIEQYRALIALHPKSPYVPDSYVQLGNFYFDCNDLLRARNAFDAAFKMHSPKTETYSEYKLAWCDINSGDYEAAKKRFKSVIARGKAKGKDEGKIRLSTEALRDIITPFRELDEMDTAIRYFQENAGMQGSRQYIKMLADSYFGAGGSKYDTAIKMYKYMLTEHKNDPNAPEWQSRVVLAFDKKGLSYRPKVLDEMRILVNNFKPGTAWYIANKTNIGAVEIAYSLTEEALYNLVTDYHQEAIKTKSVATYRLARDIYREYIDNFPATERAYQMRFYYAEILYALEEFQAGYEQYVKVAYDKEREDYKRQAATNMLLAAENLVKIEEGNYKKTIDDSSKKIDEKKDKGIIEQKQMVKIDKNAKEEQLTTLEQQLIKAIDQYVELIPNAEDEARVRLRAAVLYFYRVQYVEAARRFGYIINKWPEEKSSATAALLILESLETKEEWEALNKLARENAANKRLLAGAGKEKDELKKKLPTYIEGSQFKIASETNTVKKDYPAAAKQFRDFVAEFPKSKFAPIGLYNAFVIFQTAKELDTAISMGEKLLADYPDVDKDEWRTLPGAEGSEKRPLILPLLIFDLGKNYERIADFASAARYYEKFATDFPADDRTPDAQLNAGLWYRGLGESEKAIAAYLKYNKIYTEKKPPDRERLKLPPTSSIDFTIALIREGNKDWPKTVVAFGEYVKKYEGKDEAWKLQSARYKQLLALYAQRDAMKLLTGKEAPKPADLAKVVTDGGKLVTDILAAQEKMAEADKKQESSKLAAAHAKFVTLEPKFEAYTKMVFSSNKTLGADLKKKLEAKKALEVDYAGVVQYGNGDWAIAALVRFAMLPKLFAKSLLEAPMPKGLDFDQEELYRATLEEKALEFEEPAITSLETALAKSFELGIYNEWTLESERLLGEFKPDLFSEVKELPLKGSEFFFTASSPGGAPAGGGDGQ